MLTIKFDWNTVINNKDNIEIKNYEDKSLILTKLPKTSKPTNDSHNLTSPLTTEISWLRSVVWEKQYFWEKGGGIDADMSVRHYPVCISPRREGNCDISGPGFVEDFIEGTMINVFVTASHPELGPQVTTRSSLDATGTFYSKRSFMELFKDALAVEGKNLDNTTFPFDEEKGREGNADSALAAHFWSFVLQHPENRFVGVVSRPCLYLIHEGWTFEDGTVKILQRPSGTSWQLPVKYECGCDEASVSARLSELETTYGPTWQGLVLRLADGNRKKFIQSAYSRIRNWRSEPRQDIRLLWLVRENSQIVAEYIKYFPEDLDRFLELNRVISRICRDLYIAYQDIHIRRSKKKEEVSDYYHPHIFALHGRYLNILKPKGWFIRIKEVRDYIGEMPWQRLNYIIRRIEGKIAAPTAAAAVGADSFPIQVSG